MEYRILVYKNKKIFMREALKRLSENVWGYKWAKVESGSYSFEIASSSGTIKAVTYKHTAFCDGIYSLCARG